MEAQGRCIIGLTGDVGSGKSTIRAWLAERGAATLDADAVVHDLLAGDAAIVAAVAARFGPSVRDPAGGIDRNAMAAVAFRDPTALADLERILHPAVIRTTRAWLAEASAAVAVVEAVKLVEAGMHVDCTAVWLVACDAAVRRVRLRGRGWSPDAIERRMSAAPPLRPRLAAATEVIDNSGSIEATAAQLEAAWGRLGCRAEPVPGSERAVGRSAEVEAKAEDEVVDEVEKWESRRGR